VLDPNDLEANNFPPLLEPRVHAMTLHRVPVGVAPHDAPVIEYQNIGDLADHVPLIVVTIAYVSDIVFIASIIAVVGIVILVCIAVGVVISSPIVVRVVFGSVV
jgi:hypothetical protein